jgi:hypothetical protein
MKSRRGLNKKERWEEGVFVPLKLTQEILEGYLVSVKGKVADANLLGNEDMMLAATSGQGCTTRVLRFGAGSQRLAWWGACFFIQLRPPASGEQATWSKVAPGSPIVAAWSQGNLDGQRDSLSR